MLDYSNNTDYLMFVPYTYFITTIVIVGSTRIIVTIIATDIAVDVIIIDVINYSNIIIVEGQVDHRNIYLILVGNFFRMAYRI